DVSGTDGTRGGLRYCQGAGMGQSTMNQHRVVIVGMGKRGLHHGTAFNANPRFKVVGICDIDKGRLEAAAAKVGNPKTSTDAAALAKELKPDLFCFCTLPNL